MSLHHEIEQETPNHPVDMIEHIALINDWSFERNQADEISISVRGGWSDYFISFNWLSEIESLHIAASFDLKVPPARQDEVQKLIHKINEQLWIGHFSFRKEEGAILFRHSHLLCGGADINPSQCETLMRSATDACDLYYQAFQFILWAGKSADYALESVMFETKGEA